LGLLPLIIATVIFAATAHMGIHGRGDGPQAGAVLVAVAVGLWWLGRKLNRGASFSQAPHSLFMIPLQYCAIPLAAAGAFLAVATLMAPP
jgi:low temperature requirement protein LtrA